VTRVNGERTGILKGRLITRAAVVMAVACSLTAVAAEASVAQAAPDHVARTQVVKIASRHSFGRILTTLRGRSLYVLPTGSCTGGCLSVWPVLLMPRGRGHTMPVGTSCLGTAKFGNRFQVTYRHHRLYLFTGDSGNSVNGNNVEGFKVARLVLRSCPMT
jgi:hypothetical protein